MAAVTATSLASNVHPPDNVWQTDAVPTTDVSVDTKNVVASDHTVPVAAEVASIGVTTQSDAGAINLPVTTTATTMTTATTATSHVSAAPAVHHQISAGVTVQQADIPLTGAAVAPTDGAKEREMPSCASANRHLDFEPLDAFSMSTHHPTDQHQHAHSFDALAEHGGLDALNAHTLDTLQNAEDLFADNAINHPVASASSSSSSSVHALPTLPVPTGGTHYPGTGASHPPPIGFAYPSGEFNAPSLPYTQAPPSYGYYPIGVPPGANTPFPPTSGGAYPTHSAYAHTIYDANGKPVLGNPIASYSVTAGAGKRKRDGTSGDAAVDSGDGNGSGDSSDSEAEKKTVKRTTTPTAAAKKRKANERSPQADGTPRSRGRPKGTTDKKVRRPKGFRTDPNWDESQYKADAEKSVNEFRTIHKKTGRRGVRKGAAPVSTVIATATAASMVSPKQKRETAATGAIPRRALLASQNKDESDSDEADGFDDVEDAADDDGEAVGEDLAPRTTSLLPKKAAASVTPTLTGGKSVFKTTNAPKPTAMTTTSASVRVGDVDAQPVTVGNSVGGNSRSFVDDGKNAIPISEQLEGLLQPFLTSLRTAITPLLLQHAQLPKITPWCLQTADAKIVAQWAELQRLPVNPQQTGHVVFALLNSCHHLIEGKVQREVQSWMRSLCAWLVNHHNSVLGSYWNRLPRTEVVGVPATSFPTTATTAAATTAISASATAAATATATATATAAPLFPGSSLMSGANARPLLTTEQKTASAFVARAQKVDVNIIMKPPSRLNQCVAQELDTVTANRVYDSTLTATKARPLLNTILVTQVTSVATQKRAPSAQAFVPTKVVAAPTYSALSKTHVTSTMNVSDLTSGVSETLKTKVAAPTASTASMSTTKTAAQIVAAAPTTKATAPVLAACTSTTPTVKTTASIPPTATATASSIPIRAVGANVGGMQQPTQSGPSPIATIPASKVVLSSGKGVTSSTPIVVVVAAKPAATVPAIKPASTNLVTEGSKVTPSQSIIKSKLVPPPCNATASKTAAKPIAKPFMPAPKTTVATAVPLKTTAATTAAPRAAVKRAAPAPKPVLKPKPKPTVTKRAPSLTKPAPTSSLTKRTPLLPSTSSSASTLTIQKQKAELLSIMLNRVKNGAALPSHDNGEGNDENDEEDGAEEDADEEAGDAENDV